MNFCLPKELTEKFKTALKDGSINPGKLAEMTSKERRAYLEGFVGKNDAKNVNALFESKLLLKNQQAGMIRWAKSVAGLTKEARRDLISRIERMDKVLSPQNEAMFLEDLASKKLGTEVTFAEAKKITELSEQIAIARQDISTEAKRINYGEKVLDMHNYLEELNPKNGSLFSNIINIPKTLRSTLDFSAPFRQGWGMISRKEFYTAFPEMFKYALSEKKFNQLKADIISRPTYEAMQKGGLRVSSLATQLSKREEQYMTRLLGKLPGIKNAERAYVGFLNKLRADVFDHLYNLAKLKGEDVRPNGQVVKDLANVVNDFTGSGNIGTNDRHSSMVANLNGLLFSPRKLSATMNILNPVRYVNPKVSPTARKAALRQLVGSVAMTTAVIAMLKMAGGEAETDPRSSDFGKSKFGDTRFDFTGGNGTYAVLLSRIITNETKSSTTGRTKELGKTFGSDDRLDVALRFGRNKLAPLPAYLVNAALGENAVGDEFETGKDTLELFTPMIISNIIETAQEDSTTAFWTAFADMFGIGSQTY